MYLLEEAEFLSNHIDYLKKNIQHIQSGGAGELRIGFVGSAMNSVIPGLIASIQEKIPGMHTAD